MQETTHVAFAMVPPVRYDGSRQIETAQLANCSGNLINHFVRSHGLAIRKCFVCPGNMCLDALVLVYASKARSYRMNAPDRCVAHSHIWFVRGMSQHKCSNDADECWEAMPSVCI